MEKIFNPRSIAIVGASASQGKIGNILLENLKKKKKIKVFPVNPNHEKILGLKCFSSVLDIDEQVDLAIIAVPAKFVNQIVQECAWHSQSIKNIIIISAGFAEVGEEGQKRSDELQGLIREYGLNVLGPNCLGVVNVTEDLNLSFAKRKISVGRVGLISQSGAFITSLIDIAEKEAFGFSLIASLGNKIDLNENDLLDYYAGDKNTELIALYLESISVGQEFRKKLKKITKIKPVVIIKAGRNKKTQTAIQSHTGSMTGEMVIVDEVIKSAGGILVETLEDFVAVINVLTKFYSKNRLKPEAFSNLVIVTNAGGPGVITTDLIESYRLGLKDFSVREKKYLVKNLPEESSVHNPIDLLGDALADRYRETLKTLINFKTKIDGILVLVTPQAQTPTEEIAEVIVKINQKSKIPIFPVVIGGKAGELANGILVKYGLINFPFPVVLIRALKNIETRRSVLITGKKEDSRGTTKNKLLSYGEAEKMAEEFNLNILKGKYIREEEDLRKIDEKEFPLVMKVDSPRVVHKNTKNGVVVGLENISMAVRELKRFKKDFPGEKIIVQHQLEKGLEIILGFKRDDNFGLIIVAGLGGIITEIIDEKIIWVGKIRKKDVKEKLENSKLGEIFKKMKIPLNDLVAQVIKLLKLGEQNPHLVEVDVNPMFFYPHQKPIIVDFKIFEK